jgi:V8-like Glu-specific endopeptidase
MKKYLIALLITILMVFLCCVFSYGEETAETNEDILKEMTNSSISIFSLGQGSFGRCSGVLIESKQGLNSILTAKHCVDTYEETYVDGNIVELTLASKNDDLAMLLVKGEIKNKVPAKIADNLTIEEPVYVVGYPNSDIYMDTGTLLIKTNDWEFLKLYVKPGCSGSGIFNSKNELVGIVWGGASTEDLAIIEPISDIKQFLKEVKLYTKWLNP